MSVGRDAFGNLQGGEGFAGAAGHDEFAAVGGFETVQNVADGDGLIFTRFLLRAKTEVLRALEAELRPVNGAGFEVVNGEAIDGLGLVRDGVVGVFAPAIGGGNDDAGREQRMAEGGEIGINVFLREGVLRQIEFTLDATEFPGGAFFRDEIYADVTDLAFLRPVVEEPNAGEALGIDGVELKVTPDKPFETVAEVAVGSGGLTKLREDVMDRNFRHADRDSLARESVLSAGCSLEGTTCPKEGGVTY